MSTTKVCNAVGCGLTIAENQLMCNKHWNLLPYKLQEEIVDGVISLSDTRMSSKLGHALHNAKVFLSTVK